MTKEILVPENHNSSEHLHDPYTDEGARIILKRFRDDLLAMLWEMEKNHELYADSAGKTFLAQSPLRSKPFVAAAMKTLGLVLERPSENGACALVLTQKGHRQVLYARDKGLI